jgi:hypothetical protein
MFTLNKKKIIKKNGILSNRFVFRTFIFDPQVKLLGGITRDEVLYIRFLLYITTEIIKNKKSYTFIEIELILKELKERSSPTYEIHRNLSLAEQMHFVLNLCSKTIYNNYLSFLYSVKNYIEITYSPDPYLTAEKFDKYIVKSGGLFKDEVQELLEKLTIIYNQLSFDLNDISFIDQIFLNILLFLFKIEINILSVRVFLK